MPDPVGILLFKEKQTRLLLLLYNTNKEWHLSELAKSADVTYVHASRFISRCEEVGIVATEKHGRTKRLFLTDKGKEIAQNLLSMMNTINKMQAAVPKAASPPAKEAAPAK